MAIRVDRKCRFLGGQCSYLLKSLLFFFKTKTRGNIAILQDIRWVWRLYDGLSIVKKAFLFSMLLMHGSINLCVCVHAWVCSESEEKHAVIPSKYTVDESICKQTQMVHRNTSPLILFKVIHSCPFWYPWLSLLVTINFLEYMLVSKAHNFLIELFLFMK